MHKVNRKLKYHFKKAWLKKYTPKPTIFILFSRITWNNSYLKYIFLIFSMNLEKHYWDSIWWITAHVRICGKLVLSITRSSVWTDHSHLRRTSLHIISLWVPSSATGKCWFEIYGKEYDWVDSSSINTGNYLESILKHNSSMFWILQLFPFPVGLSLKCH